MMLLVQNVWPKRNALEPSFGIFYLPANYLFRSAVELLHVRDGPAQHREVLARERLGLPGEPRDLG